MRRGWLCWTWLLWAAGTVAAEPTEILNADSLYRLHLSFKTPALVTASGKLAPLLEPPRREAKDADRKPVPVVQSPPPPAGWTAVDFDDRGWTRDRLPVEFPGRFGGKVHAPGNPSEWRTIAARGKFQVADPAQCTGLKLSLTYAGGVVVYVNGREVTRAHMPVGEIGPDTPAEPYPDEAYLTPDGKKLPLPREPKDLKLHADRYALRRRRLVGAAIPAAMLRKGTNVLAVEVHRSPLRDAWLTANYEKVDWHGEWGPFGHAELVELSLTAGEGSAVALNTSRPAGLQVWTSRAWENLLAWDYGDACERAAVELAGVRNGAFSGRIVLSSTGPIEGVKVAASGLRASGGPTIPASAIQIRYARQASRPTCWISAWAASGHARFDGLMPGPGLRLDAAATDVPRRGHSPWTTPRVQPGPSAMVPVWVTVHVPAESPAGMYEGNVTVSAEGLEPTDVPFRIRVHAWTLPQPADFVSHNNLYQSHESTALYYGVPFWSDAHFKLMGESLALSGLAANRFCVVHLVCRAYHMGNSQSMVRWIRKDDGTYEHDFSILDRYLDLYAARLGKPGLVLLSVFVRDADAIDKKTGQVARWCMVSRLDPATGKVEPMPQPPYGTPESVAFWRPVLTEVRKRLEKRGWWEVAALGTGSDSFPLPATVATFHEIWPDGAWMSSSHMRPTFYDMGGKKRVPVYDREAVWGVGGLYNPDDPRAKGYPRPWQADDRYRIWAFPRVGQEVCEAMYEGSRLGLHRYVFEGSLQGGITGIGRIGADFLPIPDKAVEGRYLSLSGPSEAHLGPSASTRCLVAPGSDGPIATERLELLREGVQIREAIVFLQKAQADKSLPADLAGRIAALLDDRARAYVRTRPDTVGLWIAFEAGCDERDARLFALCAEVAGRIAD